MTRSFLSLNQQNEFLEQSLVDIEKLVVLFGNQANHFLEALNEKTDRNTLSKGLELIGESVRGLLKAQLDVQGVRTLPASRMFPPDETNPQAKEELFQTLNIDQRQALKDVKRKFDAVFIQLRRVYSTLLGEIIEFCNLVEKICNRQLIPEEELRDLKIGNSIVVDFSLKKASKAMKKLLELIRDLQEALRSV